MLTGRLVKLRPIGGDDAERWRAWMNDREVTLYYNRGYPVSSAEQAEWLQRVSQELGPPNLTLAIETLDARHIGIINLEAISQESRVAELGIVIGDKQYWSHGYGTDAILTLLRFAFDEINLNRVWLDVHEDNLRAIACYRKCGFIEEARLRQHRFRAGRYGDSLIMAVLAEEYRSRQPDGSIQVRA